MYHFFTKLRQPQIVPLWWLVALLLISACAPQAEQNSADQEPTLYLPVAQYESQRPNLLANGSFESGNLDGWLSGDTTSTSNAEAHSGSWSARVANAGAGTAGMQADIGTKPGDTYKLTAWAKIASESGDDWGGFRFEATTWDWKSLATSGPLLAAAHNNVWFKIALTFTAASAQTRLQIGYFGGPGRSQVVHVDDLELFAKQPNLPPKVAINLTPNAIDQLPLTQQYSVSGDDPDGAIVRVAWDFGDGTRALAATGTRRVAAPGSYIATVRVADDEGTMISKTISWSAAGGNLPTLTIATPMLDNLVVHSATLAISGSASTSATSVRVSSDRDFAGAASGTANWAAQVPLQPGWNRLLVQASNANGQISTAERLVRYIPEPPLRVSRLAESAPLIERWTPLEVTFTLENSAATNPQFPYDPAPVPGLEWIDGASVDALFTPDNWQTVYRRPAFRNQHYQRALKNDQEWLYPTGEPVWTARFAAPSAGAWKYRIAATEARGTTQSDERSFTVTTAGSSGNHGPIRVAPHDSRYFEYADGTPFLGAGHSLSFSPERFSYDAVSQFDAIGSGNQNFFRAWLGGDIWGSAWQPWNSLTTDYGGYLPGTSLTLDRAYGNGLAALKLDAANPIVLQGWNTGHIGLVPGRAYRMRVRWRTEGVSGPQMPGQAYGVTLKLTSWIQPGQTSALPALIPHVHGDTPWHIAEADFSATEDFIPYVSLILENTSAGAAYIDEIDLYEVLPNGTLGPQLLRGSRLNSLFAFEPRRAAALDTILAEAAARNTSFELVISEKDEYLLNHLAPDGLPDPNGGHFNERANTPTHRLHEYYWRHLFARFGAFRSVHSWELVNEASPDFGDHFRLAADLAKVAAADGNPHLVTTSTWATLAEGAWKNPESAPINFVNVHVYARGTGWIDPKDALANDSARFFSEYDQAAGKADFAKPVVWGEQGIDNNSGPDPLLANDHQGVWLHKLVWARCGPGGIYPLPWWSEQIFAKSLHPIFGAWNRFMAGIPLTNGNYVNIEGVASQPDLRIFGQKDLHAGSAYAWIDNRHHTWRAVVDGQSIPAVSGTVSIAMQAAGATYSVTWYDTATGQPAKTETRAADAAGTLTLNISTLQTDIAVKITRTAQ